MGLVKSVQRLWTKTMQFISLTEQNSTIISLLGNGYRFGTQSRDFLLEAYGLNPYVFMVVDRICRRLTQIEKMVLGKGDKEVIDPDFQRLIDTPNTRENGNIFLYRAAATYLAAGECFIVRHQALGEDDQYFVPVNYNVIINADTRGNVLSYRVTMFGNSEVYMPYDVLHIYKPDITMDTNHGFSALRATRKVWESNNEVWASEASLHKNKGITGVLYSDGNRPMTDKEQKDLQEKYDQDYTGQASFGKVKVSTSKLGYIQMGMNPNDLKSIETRLEHLRTVCAAYNVDSKLFGDSAASTYNNMAEAQRAFILNAVLPLSHELLPKISMFMARSLLKVYRIMLVEEEIMELQLTKEQRSARVGREVIQGILTTREARDMLYPELISDEGESAGNPGSADKPNVQAQVQGILAVQQSVVNGTTSRESATAILMAVYGFDEQTANDILQ